MRTGTLRKIAFPVDDARRYLEPGPVVLVTSSWKGRHTIMTMGWHTVMEFSPSLVGCVISSANHTYEMVRRSRECVLNVPTVALVDEVVGIGTCSGAEVDKFERFGLTADAAQGVRAPLIRECVAHFECRLADARFVDKYNFFVWRIVRARAAAAPRHPPTLHYMGKGTFMVAGRIIHRRKAEHL